MSSILKSLQLQIADLLTADPRFALMTVLTENLKDVDSEMDICIGPEPRVDGGPYGIVALVLTPQADVDWANVFGPFFDKISVVVDIWENVQTNRAPGGTQLPCQDAIENAVNVLHQSYPTAVNGPIVSVTPSLRIVPNEQGFLRYQARFQTMGGLRTVPPQLDAPGSSNSGGTYTLTTTTPGAALFYTFDGSNPSPRNAVSPGTAALYLNPITPAPGNTLQVKAWLAGYTSSPVTKINT